MSYSIGNESASSAEVTEYDRAMSRGFTMVPDSSVTDTSELNCTGTPAIGVCSIKIWNVTSRITGVGVTVGVTVGVLVGVLVGVTVDVGVTVGVLVGVGVSVGVLVGVNVGVIVGVSVGV